MNFRLCLKLLVLLLLTEGSSEDALFDEFGESWYYNPATELYDDCRPFAEEFGNVVNDFVRCSMNSSLPPQICTLCFEQYAEYRKYVDLLRNLNNVSTRDNRTCAAAIFDNFVISYPQEFSENFAERVWGLSKCDNCITWDPKLPNVNATGTVTNQTLEVMVKMNVFDECIGRYAKPVTVGNETGVCTSCKDPFNDLFHYYWDVYTRPDVDFCVDVESKMNDTIRLWHNVFGCAELPNKIQDAQLIAITAGLLVLFTLVFYAASVIQGEAEHRRLVNYSRLEPVRPDRMGLISSSSSDNNLSARTSSTSSHLAVPSHPRVHRLQQLGD